MTWRWLAVLLSVMAASPVASQQVGPCNDGRSGAHALVEPWEQSTRLFANGAVRLAITDITEPAAGSFFLMILSPPLDELGLRQCRLVRASDGVGFAGLTLDGIVATYDPAAGLRFVLPARRYVPESGDFTDATLAVTLNQATGAIRARLD